MTIIRRINVSQIDGNNANNTDANEIRPFGETSFHLDTSGTDKLVLMMFDGIRTNLKSKVLSPGILFGSNADSGDGSEYDTIKLIPDSEIYNNSSDQYIVIDPTAPNHIHIRAGGTQDDSSAQLFLGGENSYFSIGSGSNPAAYIAANNNVWTFDVTGDLTVPNYIVFEGGSYIGDEPGFEEPGFRIVAPSGYGATITTDAAENGNNFVWNFDNNGRTTFPTPAVPTTSIGQADDKQGMVVFSSSYIYYCTADYDGSTNIWKRLQWSVDTW